MSFKTKLPILWTTAECVSWIESLASDSKIRSDLRVAFIEEMKENEFVGDDLPDILSSPKILYEQLKERLPTLKITDAKKVFKAYTILQQSFAGNAGSILNMISEENNGSTQPTKPDNGKFTVMIDKGSKIIKIPDMTSQHTVSDLKSVIRDLAGLTDFSLNYHMELNDNETLGKYGIGNDTVVRVIVRTNGGTTSMVANRRHISYSKFPNIKKTLKPDCLFGFKFTEGYSVAEMPCGHVMEAGSMHMYIESNIGKNLHSKIVIKCPLPKCKTMWDFALCCRVAGMSDEEYVKMSRLRDIRGRDDVRECPNCQSLCKRKTNVAILRVNCEGCKGSDWCWVCGKTWRSGSLMVCNNKECPFVASLNEELSSCNKSVPSGWQNVTAPAGKTKELPDIRACPGCLQLTFKPSGCKHMDCKGCGKKFCFACLKDQSDCINYSHTKYCPVHPIQHFS